MITTPGKVSLSMRHGLNEQWKAMFKGTELEGVPVILLEQGMKLEVIDKAED